MSRVSVRPEPREKLAAEVGGLISVRETTYVGADQLLICSSRDRESELRLRKRSRGNVPLRVHARVRTCARVAAATRRRRDRKFIGDHPRDSAPPRRNVEAIITGINATAIAATITRPP